jgi:hypothetical protein
MLFREEDKIGDLADDGIKDLGLSEMLFMPQFCSWYGVL